MSDVLEKIKMEGDKYKFKAMGMPALLLRHPELKNWCGYVGVVSASILYKVNYTHCCDCEFCGAPGYVKELSNITVHGGLTYSGFRENDDVWYFGFDTSHFGDWHINLPNIPAFSEYVYRDKEYCIDQCISLAKQLKAIEKKYSPAPNK